MNSHVNIWMFLGLLLISLVFKSCEDDADDAHGTTPIVVNAIYLQDAESPVPDRLVEFIRLGQVMRIEGSGFTGMRRLFINGYETYFNPVYVTDNNMLVRLSRYTPTIEAGEGTRNTIRLVKAGTELVHEFQIRDAAPAISSISHTMPRAGEEITIIGSGLVEINRVVFPGDVVVTTGIYSDVDGEFVRVTVPPGITQSGSIFVEGSNGGAFSPAYFNFREGLILNFDGAGSHGSWGSATSMILPTDLLSAPIGVGNVSQGTYVPHRPARIDEFAGAANRRSEVWTAGNNVDDWRRDFAQFIPPNTPVREFAFQFDIHVPQPWANTGFLKILLFNGFNGGEWNGAVYNYVPWIVDREVVPFQTDGWVTVTIPFSSFYAFSDPNEDFTFEDVLLTRAGAAWQNFGIYFENSDFTLANVTRNNADTREFPSSPTSVSVYTDNWRIVPLETPIFSDFPEDAE